jgi:hypothetical protein
MLKINKNGSLRLPFFLLRIRDFMLSILFIPIKHNFWDLEKASLNVQV